MGSDRKFGIIVEIGDILVSEDVFTTFFCCDYSKCKGICCVEGDAGAPLGEEEPEQLEKWYPKYSPLMTDAGRKRIDETGFFEIDPDGDMVTPVYDLPDAPGQAPCAYSFFENGSCFCAVERCFDRGGCAWRKPISCSLYPIRVTVMPNGKKALNVHRWHICRDAYDKGVIEGIRVWQFLKEPLTRAFGQEFYEALEIAAAEIAAH